MAKASKPKTTKTTTVVTEEAPEQTAAQPTPLSVGQAATDAEAADEGAGKQPRAEVWRVSESGKRVYLCEIAPENVTEAFFQQHFGGGTYHTLKWKRAPTGSDRLLVRAGERDIYIDPRIPPRLPSWIATDAAAGLSATVEGEPRTRRRREEEDDDGDDGEMRSLYRHRILDIIKDGDDQRARLSEMQITMLSTVMSTMKQMTESTATLVESVSKGRGEKDPTATVFALLDRLERSRPALPVGPTPATGAPSAAPDPMAALDRAFGLLLKFRDAVEDLPLPASAAPPAAGGDSGMVESVVKLLLPILTPILTNAAFAAPGGGAPPAPMMPPPPPRAPVAPLASPPPVREVGPVSAPPWLSMARASLLEAAEEARDAGDVVASLMTLAPRKTHGGIREFILNPDPVTDFITLAPEFAPYRTWVTECIQALLAWFVEEDGGVQSPAPGAPAP